MHSLAPIIFGTGGLRGPEGIATMLEAASSGYEWFDTAAAYENEQEVASAKKRADSLSLPFKVITKLSGHSHGYRSTQEAIEQSRLKLKCDTIDCYLIHWPEPTRNLYQESWKAMVRAQEQGLIRTIGVSNFTPTLIESLIDHTGIRPEVAQIECHPWWPQHETVSWLQQNNIDTQAWSPLRKNEGNILADPTITQVAHSLNLSPAQAIIYWLKERNITPVIKSRNSLHIRENFAAAHLPVGRKRRTAAICDITFRSPRGHNPSTYVS